MPSTPQVLHVAVVDDEAPLGAAVKRILDKYRGHVETVDVDVIYTSSYFVSGEEFLESVDSGEDYDLLLLDLKLPGLSGLEVLAELAKQERQLVTVMITAYATFETAVQATKLGAYDFLPKPFAPEELRYSLRKATDHLIIGREARRLAEEKRHVRFNFISVLSHELKAPLNAIESYLKILQDQESDEHRHIIDRSLIRLEGMRKLIFDLLDLTRIESGQKARDFAQVDVASVARESVELLSTEAADNDVEVTLATPGPVEMTADAGELGIIFNNLVSNAIKYNRRGGTVTVSLEREADLVTVQVADTGIGLTPEESSKIFNDFVRIKNEETADILGSGLGLSTVRKLARLYHGKASVQSEKGVGSTFSVTLRDAESATQN